MNKAYLSFTRNEWAKLAPNKDLQITKKEISQVRSLGDVLDLTDIHEIYTSLVAYLYLEFSERQKVRLKQGEFLHKKMVASPFIIGISGSVAVGKSTTARLLQLLLSRTYPELQVQLMTTDGFLYNNAELKRRNLMPRKGFPESYNMQLLSDFLTDVAAGKKDVVFPLYSQELSDIVPGKYDHVKQPDILIVEGINTLQLPQSGQIVTSDYFDFSIYIDAEEDLIESWYMQRFEKLLELNKNDPQNYYYALANGPREAALRLAEETWQMVNLVNLRQYIAPTRKRANLILHKTTGHLINRVYLRQF